MAVGRPLPTRSKVRVQEPPPPPKNDTHKCRIKLEDPSVLPDFEIELYWKEEKQWWRMDRKTILHDFWRVGEGCGRCIASWGYRKNVECKWRRVSDDNEYDEEESGSESESESVVDISCPLLPLKTSTAMGVDRPLPTGSHVTAEEATSPPRNDVHKCRIKLEDASVLPDFEIKLYWRDENQWWYLDSNTTIHELWWTGDDCGKCIVSWLKVREHVRCKWKKMSHEGDYGEKGSDSDIEPESETESEVNAEPEQDDDEEETLESIVDPSDYAWESNDSETDDDEDDEDYRPNLGTKRRRFGLPCEETEAMFGETRIIKGGIYRRHVSEDDAFLVKVVAFTGKKFPVRRARCQILFRLHTAIQDCFPKAGRECIREDRRMVYEEAVRGRHFLETLKECDADFDNLCQHVYFDLRRDRRDKDEQVLVELRRRRLRETPPSIIPKQPSSTPKELVLFAGIGGCSMGDKEAGFDVSWLVEKDQLAAASLKQSHPDAIVYAEDVRSFLGNCKKGKSGYPSRGDVGHLQSSSPCTGFSGLNRGGGANDEENNALSLEMVRATDIFRPKTGMMENVPGMLDASNVHHAIGILQQLTDLDYQIRIAIHNSCDFGAPQRRRRLIFTFSRADVKLPDMPVPTHGTHGEGLAPFVTVGDAIQDLTDIHCDMAVDTKSNYYSGLVQLPNNKVTFNHVAAKPREHSHTLCLDEPLNTMTTQNTFVHPQHPHRTLSIRELARLFDLPDDKQFFGSLTSIRKQIGNSVPVKLAKAIATSILAVHKESTSIED